MRYQYNVKVWGRKTNIEHVASYIDINVTSKAERGEHAEIPSAAQRKFWACRLQRVGKRRRKRPDYGWYENMTGASSQMDCSTTEGVELGKFRICNVYKERHILEGQENTIMIRQIVQEGLW